MLVLRRVEGQTIEMGAVVIKILGVEGGEVVVGIDAPGHVPIIRGECSENARRELESRARGSAGSGDAITRGRR